MANYNSLKATIDAQIKANGVQAITGPILNAVLTAMINTIGNGYSLQGSVAQTTDNPGAPDNPVAYLAAGPGTYTNFGATVIPDDGHAYLLTWDTSWHAVQLPLPTYDLANGKQDALTFDDNPTPGSDNPVKSNGIAEALDTKQDKDTGDTAGHVAVMDGNGNSVDGGEALSDLATKEDVEAVEQEVAQVAGEAGLAEAVIDTDNAGTEQEFIFRKSGGDGGAYYRKILGRTLAINQQVKMPTALDTNGWSYLQNPVYNADGSFTLTPTADWGGGAYNTYTPIIGHKYYARFSLQCADLIRVFIGGVYLTEPNAYPTKTYLSAVIEATSNQALSLWGTQGVPATLWDIEVVDLTLMFGAGNEPSTVAELEALYPNPLPYNPGTLISNDADAVETTGRNQYNPATGKAQVIGGQNYYIGGTYTSLSQGGVAITPAGDSTFTPASTGEVEVVGGNATDTIINISDADNGLWQPYWKRTLQLGLTTKEDTDGNVPFPNGLQSCPVAQDEATKEGGTIRVGTRAYQAGDESDADVITDGTNTNYALTTPQTFTWAEPLNLGVKVDENGTERAVAPEGATAPSAPFVADTTYTMSIARMVAILQGI